LPPPTEHVLAVVEVDAHEALRPGGQLDRPMEAGEHGVEAAGLQRGLLGEVGPRDAAGEAEVVLDARARAGLPARRPVGVGVVPAHGEEVALQPVAHLEGAARVAPGDQPHHAVPGLDVPGAAGQQRREDVLAELRPARDHVT
jgi:hypothetical protein